MKLENKRIIFAAKQWAYAERRLRLRGDGLLGPITKEEERRILVACDATEQELLDAVEGSPKFLRSKP